MSESTLSIKYEDLLAEVGRFLGYGLDQSAWTAEQLKDVDLYVQSGLRQFYYPPAVNGAEIGYAWSFLNPTAAITTAIDDQAQDLPDDFGRILGNLYFDASLHLRPIPVMSEGFMQNMASSDATTGQPKFAAVRAKASTGAAGQRMEIVWWPIPNAVFTLAYRYEAYSGKLTSTKPYPLGGMRFAELLTESCLAIAEQKANDERGLHTERFTALLVAGIAMDRKSGARNYGQMGVAESDDVGRTRNQNGTITYKGEVL